MSAQQRNEREKVKVKGGVDISFCVCLYFCKWSFETVVFLKERIRFSFEREVAFNHLGREAKTDGNLTEKHEPFVFLLYAGYARLSLNRPRHINA